MFLVDRSTPSLTEQVELSPRETVILSELRSPDLPNDFTREMLQEFGSRHGLAGVSAASHQGTCEEEEDGMAVVLEQGIIGVFDGMSNVHFGNVAKNRWNDRTVGECVRSVVTSEFNLSDDPLWETIANANAGVAHFQIRCGLSLADTIKLAGVVGTAIQLKAQTVECYQWGDCFSVWKMKDGTSGMTPNQFTQFDAVTSAKWDNIALKYNGDPRAAWAEYGPFFAEQRRRFVNNTAGGGFGFLNGQSSFLSSIQRFELPRDKLEYLLLMSDTLVKGLESLPAGRLAACLTERYDQGGIEGLYLPPRVYEEGDHNSHIPGKKGEATVVALLF